MSRIAKVIGYTVLAWVGALVLTELDIRRRAVR